MGATQSIEEMKSSHGDRQSVLEEMARGEALVRQLRAIVLPALPEDERWEVVARMIDNILDSSAKATASLRLQLRQSDAPAALPAAVMDDINKASNTGDKPLGQRKRKRSAGESVTLETPSPYYDGHNWRKYGHKSIRNAKHPRSYFRCAYEEEHGCEATKTVQQREDDSGDNLAVMYAVVYYGQHTCNSDAGVRTASTQSSGAQGPSESNTEVSVPCASVVADHHQTTSSIQSKLLEMAEVDDYERFDFDSAVCSPWDLGTSWELDEHAHETGFSAGRF